VKDKFEQLRINVHCLTSTCINLVHIVLICLVLLMLLMCQGCILVSDAKYKSDEAMWLAKAEASKAWAASANQPLATFTAVSGETFTVNNPNRPTPMPVVGEPSAIVQGFDVVLNSSVAKIVGGGWAVEKILGKVQGNYSTGEGGTMNVTQDSNNSVDVTTRHTEGDSSSIAEEQHDGSDNTDTSTVTTTDNRTDYDNATATPTVVNPTVVTQPAPVIVTQPTPIVVGGTTPE